MWKSSFSNGNETKHIVLTKYLSASRNRSRSDVEGFINGSYNLLLAYIRHDLLQQHISAKCTFFTRPVHVKWNAMRFLTDAFINHTWKTECISSSFDRNALYHTKQSYGQELLWTGPMHFNKKRSQRGVRGLNSGYAFVGTKDREK
jgi:hypothetical protein